MAGAANASLCDLEAAARRPIDGGAGDGVVGVLGPTNTGKTHFAIERMLGRRTGMIGLPLRLLAREIYDKLVLRIGSRDVALITGEEKIAPPNPRYWVSTVEAMPLDKEVEFLAVDEIQLAADPERGRIFTSRLLHARGAVETMFIGSGTMRPILRRLFPKIEFVSRARFSRLEYAGAKKVSRLPRRSAVVGFSVDTVYSIAELIRRQRGGAAVVLGALSPRTRNAQAELYQSGEVDYLVATDAIGMGLNMDIDHAAFAAARKFDGRHVRALRADELAQIAGRAGRHIKDGTFGITADCRPLDEDVIEQIEAHEFAPLEALQWRADRLDFSNLTALRRSLDAPSPGDLFRRARPGEDEIALARLAGAADIADRAAGPAAVALLWDVCQTPDFRKAAPDQHARLLSEIFAALMDEGRLSDAFLAPRIEPLDRTDGDIDAISTRISFVRTWTYLSNRAAWLENPAYWQGRTRSIEDALSDALHEKLTQRFVDRRTSVLLRKLRDDAPLLAGVNEDGEVFVEGQFVGRLIGFQFILDPRAKGAEAKRVRHAAEKALSPLLAARAAALANAAAGELDLKPDATIWWRSAPVARLEKGPGPLRPDLKILDIDAISPSLRGRVQDRLSDFLAAKIEANLADLVKLRHAVDAPAVEGDATALSGLARGVAFRLVENFGAMSRAPISSELKQLEQAERGKLRKLGVRFGEITLHMPSLLKPGPARLLVLLWALWSDKAPASFEPPKAGLVSFALNPDLPHAYYYASGYRPSGARAVRIDMLERLAGIVRTAREADKERQGFEANQQMMSLVGCSGEDFEGILTSLGYRKHVIQRPKPAPPPEIKAPPDASPTDAPAADAARPADQSADAASAGSTEDVAPVVSEQTSEAAPTAVEAAGAIDGSAPTPPNENAASANPMDGEDGAQGEDETKTSAAEAADGPPETASEPELIDVTLWRPAPRRPANRPAQRDGDKRGRGKPDDARDGKRARGGGQSGDGPKKTGKRPGGGRKGPRQDGPRAPRQFTSGPKRARGPDPDSPFAVLAALKGEDGDKGSGGA